MVGSNAERLVWLVAALTGSSICTEALEEGSLSVNITRSVECGHRAGGVEEMSEVLNGSGHCSDRGKRYTSTSKDDGSAAPTEFHLAPFP